MPRLTINPEEFKRAKLVKPGWYVTLVRDINEEMNSKKDGNNIVVDVENAEPGSEFIGVPAKLWFTEKFVQGIVAYVKAFTPGLDEAKAQDFEFNDSKGMYIYGKWATNRGKDGTQPPSNTVEDWAPLPKGEKYDKFRNVRRDDIGGAVSEFGV